MSPKLCFGALPLSAFISHPAVSATISCSSVSRLKASFAGTPLTAAQRRRQPDAARMLRNTTDIFRRIANCLSASQPVMGDLKSIALTPEVDVFIRPVRSDNFSYLVHDKKANVCAVVDPYSPRGLVSFAQSLGAPITTALVTHHHHDHAGGNKELARLVPGVEIVGSTYETAPAVNATMAHGDTRTIKGGSIAYKALHTPCHTNGHICFVTETPEPAAFTGDTLFVGGCGRFFEGDATDMEKSLNVTLASLPDDCLVFCGHEYTVSNLRFAVSVEPENKVLAEKLAWSLAQIEKKEHTIPSTIGEEKSFNPFMRTSEPVVAKAVGLPGGSAIDVMKALREAKNNF